MSNRSITLKVRVTPEQNEIWQAASKQALMPSLSHWIRVVVDAAAGGEPGDTHGGHRAPSAPPAESSAEGGPGSQVGQASTPAAPLPIQPSSAGKCLRWMHHRKGVFCGACGRTI